MQSKNQADQDMLYGQEDCQTEVDGLEASENAVEIEEDYKNQIRVKQIQTIPNRMQELLKSMTWIKALLNKHFELSNEEPLSEVKLIKRLEGGMGAYAGLCELKFHSGRKQLYVFKCNGDDESRMKNWTCFREGIFYSDFMPEIRERVLQELDLDIQVPKTYLSVIDPQNGRFFNLMEYIENATPLNDVLDKYRDINTFKRMLDVGHQQDGYQMYEKVVKTVAKTIANFHGANWRNKELLIKGKEHLKAAGWFHGQNKKDWDRQMIHEIQPTFHQMKQQLSQGFKDSHSQTMKMVDSQVGKINWENHVQMMQAFDFQWTTVHGDLWPNNLVWGKDSHQVHLFDFEFVGFWNPTIDLFCFLVHMPSEARQKYEKAFLDSYLEQLHKFDRVPRAYTYERLMADLVTHGIGQSARMMVVWWWLGKEGLCSHMGGRIEQFIKDHTVDVSAVPQPSYCMY